MKWLKFAGLFFVFVVAFGLGKASNHRGVLTSKPYRFLKSIFQAPPPDQFAEDNWIVAEGFGFEKVADGFRGPVDIAMVPRPGTNPSSPHYLVTEIHGAIKAVARDGSISTVAQIVDAHQAPSLMPGSEACYGLHGMCFHPTEDVVYTTSVVIQDGTLINRLTKWASIGEEPFSKLEMVKEQRDVFAGHQVLMGHSIGNCRFAMDGSLYVGVGNGLDPELSRDAASPLGKILRFDDNLEPLDPFVFASGFRNPWAITQTPEGHWFTADNGPNVDRLIRLVEGRAYPWDGSNESMLYGADMLFHKAVGPADMLFADAGPLGIERSLLISAAGLGGIVQVTIDEAGQITNPAKTLVGRPVPRYDLESITGIAMDDKGLLVAHMIYDAKEYFRASGIYRLTRGGPQTAVELSGAELFRRRGCYGCHVFDGEGARQGPELDGLSGRLVASLNDDDQRAEWADLAATVDENLAARLRNGSQLDAARAWVELKLLKPSLLIKPSAMPPPHLTAEERQRLSQYLIAN